MIDNDLETRGRRVSSGDAVERRVAAETLGALGPLAATAVPAIVRQSITDPEPLVRYALLDGLERIGWDCADHVPVFGSLLDHPDQIVQARAAWALGRVGPAAAPAVPALAAAAADEGRLVDPRWSAVVALGRLGPVSGAAAPTLLGLLSSADPDMREASARSLGLIGGERAAVAALIAAGSDPDQLVREGAAAGLGAIGPAAGDAAETLERLCGDDWPAVRASAAEAVLLVTGSPCASVAPSGDGRSGRAVAAALPTLLAGLTSGSERTRGISTFELGKLGPDAADTLPLLADLLATDSNLDVRWSAAWALGKMGVAGAGAVPALARTIVHDGDPDVRAEAASALGRIGRERGDRAEVVVGVLRAALADRDSLVREEAAWALGRLGKEAAPALRELAGRATDRHPLVRGRAVEAMAAIRRVETGG
jgi:HEAT repeat protein